MTISVLGTKLNNFQNVYKFLIECDLDRISYYTITKLLFVAKNDVGSLKGKRKAIVDDE